MSRRRFATLLSIVFLCAACSQGDSANGPVASEALALADDSAATTTTLSPEELADGGFEQAIQDEISEVDGELEELVARDFSGADSRFEQIAVLLSTDSEPVYERADGLCLIEALEGWPDVTFGELLVSNPAPSQEVLREFGDAARSCGLLDQTFVNIVGGMQNSGASAEALPMNCLHEEVATDDARVLSLLTGNSSALDYPEFLDKSSEVHSFLLVVEPCFAYGQVVAAGMTLDLTPGTVACIDEWGYTDRNLLRLLSGNIGSEEFDNALQQCWTPEELQAVSDA